jgi:hypothetical protein
MFSRVQLNPVLFRPCAPSQVAELLNRIRLLRRSNFNREAAPVFHEIASLRSQWRCILSTVSYKYGPMEWQFGMLFSFQTWPTIQRHGNSKYKYRNSKQTRIKTKMSKSSSVVLVIGKFEFDICFGFRISIFEFYKLINEIEPIAKNWDNIFETRYYLVISGLECVLWIRRYMHTHRKDPENIHNSKKIEYVFCGLMISWTKQAT